LEVLQRAPAGVRVLHEMVEQRFAGSAEEQVDDPLQGDPPCIGEGHGGEVAMSLLLTSTFAHPFRLSARRYAWALSSPRGARVP
jgi:hypothetical protein